MFNCRLRSSRARARENSACCFRAASDGSTWTKDEKRFDRSIGANELPLAAFRSNGTRERVALVGTGEGENDEDDDDDEDEEGGEVE